MEPLIEFSIPVRGLGLGLHQFDYQIDSAFFAHFEESPVKAGQFELRMYLDKRPDLMTLHVDYEGKAHTSCDRCLADIHLPVSGQGDLLFKFREGSEGEEDEQDEDVVYLSPNTPKLNVARYLYEFIILGMPMIKVYDCEEEDPRPCDQDMLKYLDHTSRTDDEPSDDDTNPIWDALKDLKD